MFHHDFVNATQVCKDIIDQLRMRTRKSNRITRAYLNILKKDVRMQNLSSKSFCVGPTQRSCYMIPYWKHKMKSHSPCLGPFNRISISLSCHLVCLILSSHSKKREASTKQKLVYLDELDVELGQSRVFVVFITSRDFFRIISHVPFKHGPYNLQRSWLHFPNRWHPWLKCTFRVIKYIDNFQPVSPPWNSSSHYLVASLWGYSVNGHPKWNKDDYDVIISVNCGVASFWSWSEYKCNL